ncbi:MAG: virulence protein SciE type [Novosphingobium sp. 17-62-19]|uniref:type VI secretion system accessory protein TagJ n=1 Tax=Novosphingobium sp. 17-62-19 TaxID=1970406 RepID=UPI000BD5D143|nr:type VI secretion system accessory protein TagJ [Novosphingobium sp. 17-62-19]OYX96580.1 MAG: virulence protein SciE type [Novosphingobium sp. 35-62-5]OZA21033.1 MAG: virulence protein SciE type [Novosphingobium sp. 17-62-19]HQS97363.1 type VI secretion system accessory protein TagJ [Novosphingobium sp.]
MENPDALLRDGDLDGARAALVDIVRTRPGDDKARMFLFQLLCVTGEWDKARKQLQALAQVADNAQMLAATYNQAIDAELLRADVFAGKADMPVLVGMGGWVEGVAQAISLGAKGQLAEAAGLRDEAFEQAPDTLGTLETASAEAQSFDWIADADTRFGPSFEAIVAGRYGLVPFDAVVSIKSEGPQDLRDTVWYPVQLALKSGQSIAAFLPARYPGSEAATSAAIRLGRQTEWAELGNGDAALEVGLGQRLWSLSDGEDTGLLDLRKLTFD